MVGREKADKELREYVAMMYPRQPQSVIVKKITTQRMRTIVMMLVLAIVIGILSYVSFNDNEIADGIITREEEDYDLKLNVKGSGKNGTWEKEMEIPVATRTLSEKEKSLLSEKVKTYLDETVAGKNSALNHVKEDMVFSSSIPDYEVTIVWIYDEDYFESSGKLRRDNIPSEGARTEVVAETSYKDWKEEFTYEVFLKVDENSQQWVMNSVMKKIEEALVSQASQENVKLPLEVDNQTVVYEQKEEEKSYTGLYVVVGLIFLMPFVFREEQKKKLEKRKEQMLCDHPGMVNKIMLLLGAGLTVRKAVERLVEEYERDLEKGKETHYAYEELCIMCQEMQDGKPEEQALESFGKRCRLLPYMRFASVVSQNIRKGAEGILSILEGDSLEALEQRKARALAEGEKAGTKLLFPMMLMLGLVMGIILVPAFMSM